MTCKPSCWCANSSNDPPPKNGDSNTLTFDMSKHCIMMSISCLRARDLPPGYRIGELMVVRNKKTQCNVVVDSVDACAATAVTNTVSTSLHVLLKRWKANGIWMAWRGTARNMAAKPRLLAMLHMER